MRLLIAFQGIVSLILSPLSFQSGPFHLWIWTNWNRILDEISNTEWQTVQIQKRLRAVSSYLDCLQKCLFWSVGMKGWPEFFLGAHIQRYNCLCYFSYSKPCHGKRITVNVLKFQTLLAIICFFMHLFYKILGGKANGADPDQTAPSGAVWAGSALFAYAILSDKLAYEILGHFP